MIVEQQNDLGWGSVVVDQLSADLQNKHPDICSFSPRNLWYLKSFYETYCAAPVFLQQLVAEIPWGQNILIFERVKDEVARHYYLDSDRTTGMNVRCTSQPNQNGCVSKWYPVSGNNPLVIA